MNVLRRRHSRNKYNKCKSNLGRFFTLERTSNGEMNLYTYPKGFKADKLHRITRIFTNEGWKDCSFTA